MTKRVAIGEKIQAAPEPAHHQRKIGGGAGAVGSLLRQGADQRLLLIKAQGEELVAGLLGIAQAKEGRECGPPDIRIRAVTNTEGRLKRQLAAGDRRAARQVQQVADCAARREHNQRQHYPEPGRPTVAAGRYLLGDRQLLAPQPIAIEGPLIDLVAHLKLVALGLNQPGQLKALLHRRFGVNLNLDLREHNRVEREHFFSLVGGCLGDSVADKLKITVVATIGKELRANQALDRSLVPV